MQVDPRVAEKLKESNGSKGLILRLRSIKTLLEETQDSSLGSLHETPGGGVGLPRIWKANLLRTKLLEEQKRGDIK